jgi:SAM-dependent methyltransferase
MSSFSADWLALREPYDERARNPAVLGAAAALVADYPLIRVVDLACGIGSMLRALGPRVAGRQMWHLVDSNRDLLAFARAMTTISAALTVELRALDLNSSLNAALVGSIDLVTASALLDLVSESWLDQLLFKIVKRRLPVYATLTYDGRAEIEPADPLDAAIIAAANAHQRTDKGFGPALGPTAVTAAIARLESMQYSVTSGISDWLIGPNDREIQMKIFAVWANAAEGFGGLSHPDRVEWLSRRRDAVIAGCSSIRIGHVDFLATPVWGLNERRRIL